MSELTVVVCIKQVPDPEAPDSAFEIDPVSMAVKPVGIPPVINPFDERALETALQLKDRFGARVIAMNIVDDKLAMPVLNKALAAGADQLVVLKDNRFVGLDSSSKAYILSEAIKHVDGCSIILVGRQAADWGFGQVGPILGEFLKIPSIGVAQRVTAEGGAVIVERLKRAGYEVLRVPTPVLLVMDGELELRLPSIGDIKNAKTKPVTTWTAADLGIDLGRLKARKVYRLHPPPSRKRECFIVDGQTMEEKGQNLALRLKNDRVI